MTNPTEDALQTHRMKRFASRGPLTIDTIGDKDRRIAELEARVKELESQIKTMRDPHGRLTDVVP